MFLAILQSTFESILRIALFLIANSELVEATIVTSKDFVPTEEPFLILFLTLSR